MSLLVPKDGRTESTDEITFRNGIFVAQKIRRSSGPLLQQQRRPDRGCNGGAFFTYRRRARIGDALARRAIRRPNQRRLSAKSFRRIIRTGHSRGGTHPNADLQAVINATPLEPHATYVARVALRRRAYGAARRLCSVAYINSASIFDQCKHRIASSVPPSHFFFADMANLVIRIPHRGLPP